jgi:hypothetical protein
MIITAMIGDKSSSLEFVIFFSNQKIETWGRMT